MLQSVCLSGLGRVSHFLPITHSLAAHLSLACAHKELNLQNSDTTLRVAHSHIFFFFCILYLRFLERGAGSHLLALGPRTDMGAGALDWELEDQASGFTLLLGGWGKSLNFQNFSDMKRSGLFWCEWSLFLGLFYAILFPWLGSWVVGHAFHHCFLNSYRSLSVLFPYSSLLMLYWNYFNTWVFWRYRPKCVSQVCSPRCFLYLGGSVNRHWLNRPYNNRWEPSIQQETPHPLKYLS